MRAVCLRSCVFLFLVAVCRGQVPSVTSVENALSFAQGPIAPGELLALPPHGTATVGGCGDRGPATRPMAPKDGDRGGTAEPLLSDHRPLRTRICWLLDRSNRLPWGAVLGVSRGDHQDGVKELGNAIKIS